MASRRRWLPAVALAALWAIAGAPVAHADGGLPAPALPTTTGVVSAVVDEPDAQAPEVVDAVDTTGGTLTPAAVPLQPSPVPAAPEQTPPTLSVPSILPKPEHAPKPAPAVVNPATAVAREHQTPARVAQPPAHRVTAAVRVMIAHRVAPKSSFRRPRSLVQHEQRTPARHVVMRRAHAVVHRADSADVRVRRTPVGPKSPFSSAASSAGTAATPAGGQVAAETSAPTATPARGPSTTLGELDDFHEHIPLFRLERPD
jgi:hypothetical protein